MSVQFQDYYKVLEVERKATAEEIQKSFRKLARKYHPDINKDPSAEERFKEINEAYEVLKDPEKRKRYDSLGANWRAGQEFRPPPGWDFGGGSSGQGGGSSFRFGNQGAEGFSFGGGGFSDFFDAIFGAGATQGGFGGFDFGGGSSGPHGHARGRRAAEQDAAGSDLQATVKISPWEACLGLKIRVKLPDGELDMKIPAGIQPGAKLRLKGKGLPGPGGKKGDAFIEIKVVVPNKLSDEERALLEKLSKVSTFKAR